MGKRRMILLGMAAAVAWGIATVWVGVTQVNLPVFSLLPALAFAFLPPGVVLLVMIARLAAVRFFDDGLIDGQAFAPGSAPWVDQRVLTNTVEQLVLALCVWPACGYLLLGDGPGVLVALGVAFALARVAFWIGYRAAPPLRAFGFAATFSATVAALLWAGLRYLVS